MDELSRVDGRDPGAQPKTVQINSSEIQRLKKSPRRHERGDASSGDVARGDRRPRRRNGREGGGKGGSGGRTPQQQPRVAAAEYGDDAAHEPVACEVLDLATVEGAAVRVVCEQAALPFAPAPPARDAVATAAIAVAAAAVAVAAACAASSDDDEDCDAVSASTGTVTALVPLAPHPSAARPRAQQRGQGREIWVGGDHRSLQVLSRLFETAFLNTVFQYANGHPALLPLSRKREQDETRI